jgi:membrane protein DedA with SNARE-associated domain
MLADFVNTMLTFLENLAARVPLEVFALIGSFIEELIAPIPSPVIMTMAGTIAQAQGRPLFYLLVVAVLSSVAKTAAGLLLYIVADKGGDFLLTRFGKFLGITQEEIEKIGAYISGGWKDDIVLFLLRSIPVMPSSPISITCGAIKINMVTFLWATFFGSIIRSMFYLYLGFTGLDAARSLLESMDTLDTIFKVLFVVVMLAAVTWGYYKRQRGELPWQKETPQSSAGQK